MTHPYTSQPEEERPHGFSYEPGNMAPVTGAPYPGGMGFVTPVQRPRRPGTITAAMVLLWVLGGLTILLALLLTLFVLMNAVVPYAGEEVSNIVILILIVLLLGGFAALMMVAAVRLPKKADSARVMALTLMGFFVFSNLSYIVLAIGTFTSGDSMVISRNVIGVFFSLLLAAMPATVIVLLSLRKSVAWFYDRSESEGPRQP